MTSSNLLTPEAAISFWEQRHLTHGALASGGDWSFDESENAIFYYKRLGTILDILGGNAAERGPLEVLDAGAGKGFFSRHLATCGHRVVAFDPSPTAVAELETAGVEARSATIEAFTWNHAFDAVVCVDVMFHILDDGAWERSLLRLAACTRLTGLLIISDHDADEEVSRGDYIVQRPPARYAEILDRTGLKRFAFHPYNFKANPNGFHVYRRGGP